MKAGSTIGEVARELRLNAKTIRYYEEIGLLPGPLRSESGYRLYSQGEINRLRLIRKAKLLGLSLADIREIIAYAIDGQCSVLEGRLLSLVETKLAEVDQKIDDLIAFREDLRQYRRDLSERRERGTKKNVELANSSACECLDNKGS